ncbi:hypothetical protein ACP4OV_009006 [Aristida adscensionis]
MMVAPLRMSTTGLLLLLVIAAASPSSFPRSGAGAAACAPKERDALLAFKKRITSDPEDLLASWRPEDEQDCCRWGGVHCSNVTGHVVELHLGGGGLTGEISRSLLSLRHLEYLNVSNNYLQGPSGQVPEFLGSFKNLMYLDLSSIPFFSGIVPPQLGNLSKLHYLNLANSMPPSTDLSWLAHMPLLRYLDMASVDLSKVADWPYMVNMLPSLRSLSLAGCGLTSMNQSLPRLNLTRLEKLDLSLNNFQHSVASCWFWNLTSLKYLNLEDNYDLYGQPPNSLGKMVSLQALYLSGSVKMRMMAADLTKLCNLTVLDLQGPVFNGNITDLIERLPHCSSNKLQELHLNGNSMVGFLPNSMGHLTSLVVFDLSGNEITGSLPAIIGNFTNLRILDLCLNHLTQHVPSEIGMLANLTYLDLKANDLEGFLTEEHLDGLRSLEYIDLSENKLRIVVGSEWQPRFRLQKVYLKSCQVGPLFPAWLQWQVNILWLDISNTGIADRIPEWFCNTFSKVTFLEISSNEVNGSLPCNMSTMSLEYLYASSNKLTGQIPQLPNNLSVLDISNNSLSGPLPSNFGAPNLDLVALHSNNISGQVPTSICEMSLYALDLKNNRMEGELPECMNMKKMAYLMLSNNSFSGNFPPFPRSCGSLSFLDLSLNRFSGTLPLWIGSCSSLQFLRLSHNMFYGHIPGSITSLTKLYHLNLANNWLSGVIPPHLSNLTFMTRMFVLNPGSDVPAGFETIVGELLINTKGQQLSYHGDGVLEILSIDFSSNYITGEIPEEVTSLQGLVNVNLSWNRLSGKIPDKIGVMHYLESLDLSNNNLLGEIPSSISNLTYLSTLDLSDNNLTGRIPSGRQLDTLYMMNPSMYDGNIGLCGPPLQRNCPSNNLSEHGDNKRDDHHLEPMFFYFGLGIGYAVGLWVVFLSLLFHKTWRIAYFRLFDKFYDKIYVFLFVTWKSCTRKPDIC